MQNGIDLAAYAANYFQVVAAWYGAVGVGRAAGDAWAAAHGARDAALYDFCVNPGHFIGYDEWVSSPFTEGSRTPLRSGQALQMDIIPVAKFEGVTAVYSNAEDGICLADGALREEIAADFPAFWARAQARRAFMRDVIGIELDESVLPMGNIPAWLPPYAGDPGTAFTMLAPPEKSD